MPLPVIDLHIATANRPNTNGTGQNATSSSDGTFASLLKSPAHEAAAAARRAAAKASTQAPVTPAVATVAQAGASPTQNPAGSKPAGPNQTGTTDDQNAAASPLEMSSKTAFGTLNGVPDEPCQSTNHSP